MTYRFNATDLTLQPTSGRWLDRETLGIDGNGRAIYPPYREFELKWGLISVSEFQQLNNFFNAIGATGTVVATLPQYGASSYTTYDYSGCILRQVEAGEYFEEWIKDASLLVVRITA